VKKLMDAGETVWRPSDFMCEMFKDDQHMDRVKQRLTDQKSRIETVERRRKVKHNKSFAKAVTVKRNERKNQMKKEAKVKKSKQSPGNYKFGKKKRG
jgi:rRNA-processing protein EBP2